MPTVATLKSVWESELKGVGRIPVLVVDDDPFQLRLIERVLLDFEIGSIALASDGTTARGILNTSPIELLLTDIDMPGMGGLELLKLIRCGRSKAPRNLRTIIFTSTSPADTLGSAISLDVNGFLPKPFTAESILQKIVLAMADSESPILEADAYASVETSLDILIQARSESAEKLADESASPVTHVDGSTPTSGEPLIDCLSIHQIKPGMTLEKDVTTIEGMVLLKSGSVLDQRKIQRLHDLRELLSSEKFQAIVVGQGSEPP